MAKSSGISVIELTAHEDKNLDTLCYRGSAPLSHLALVSQADVFDQDKNQEGLQRDLSPKHASEAYEYVSRKKIPDRPRVFPEIVLNARDKKVVKVEKNDDDGLVRITFNIAHMRNIDQGSVYVSRVDGNHRLFHAAGDARRDPLLSEAPFQLHIGLSREQERSLFVDINSNQKGLNTSHLAIMKSRLTEEEIEIRDNLDRWIAKKLVEDPRSPWHGLVHLGGSKKGARLQGLTRVLNFASIQGNVASILILPIIYGFVVDSIGNVNTV